MSAATRIPASLADLAIPVDELAPYHRNPRTGDLDSITESLSTHGQYRPIVVNRGTLTGRPNEILAGNHTFKSS
ncbi:ParB N-terminal domain-containing protein [Streptomyces sp. cg2]|uniref:ParB N-terminal domain-containing protein n=1 Tax=Streptomyces sp. cg2 TaxID=3238799 RepID=UPI0034E28383